MAVIGSATLNVVPKVQGGLANAINGEIAKANVSGLGRDAGAGFMGGFASGASIGVWSEVASRAIGAVTSSLDSAAGRVDTLKNYPRIMESLGASGSDASASISTMSDALSNVPTRLDDMASTVQGLYAATSKYGIGLGTVTDAGLALNSMLLAGGQSQAVVNSAMEQFRQMVSKGKPELQDWKSLIQAAPGQLNQLAEAMLGAGATADDLYAALGGGKESDYEGAFEWGSLGMDEFVERFAGMREQFEGAAQDAQGGIRTAYANMANSVTKGVANVLDAFGQERIAGAINDVKGLINDVFGKDDTQGLREFATEVAPLVSDAWDGMMERAKAFGEAVGPYIGSFAEKALQEVQEVAPSVGTMFDTLMESGIELLPTITDLAGTAVEVVGDTTKGLADVVTAVAPTVTSIAKDVLPVIGDIVETIGPALPAIITAKTALGGIGSVLGGLGTVGAGVQGLAKGLGGVAQVLPMIGGLSDVGPALSLIAEGGGLAAVALNPVTIAAGAAAAGVGYLGVKCYEAWHEQEELRQQSLELDEALAKARSNTEGLSTVLKDGADHSHDFGSAAGDASVNLDDMIESLERYNRKNEDTRESAEESVFMLGQYRQVIDELAGAGDVSGEQLGRLEWALDGLRKATGETYEVEQVLKGSYKDEAGEVHNLRDEIDQLIQKKQQEARVSAVQDMYTEALKQREKAKADVKAAQAEYDAEFEKWAQGTGKVAIESNMKEFGIGWDEAKESVRSFFETTAAEGPRCAETLKASKDTFAQYADDAREYSSQMDEILGQSSGIWESREAYINASEEMREALSGMSFTAGDLAKSIEDAGITVDQFATVTPEHFATMAELSGGSMGEMVGLIQNHVSMGGDAFDELAIRCSGDMNMMKLAVMAYNSEPIQQKDGQVVIDGTMLHDELGNIYTWNGTQLKDQQGRVAVNGEKLTDAYGNVLKWNDKGVDPKDVKITNSSNPIPGLIGWLDSLKRYDGTSVNTYVTNTTRNLTINEVQSKGGGSSTATGGHIEPRHASGYIAAGPTHTRWGLVGEDGVEAVYNNDDGSSDVYPLNNPRYLSYADPLGDRIARSVTKALSGGTGKAPVNVTINGVSGPEEVARAVTRALTLANM